MKTLVEIETAIKALAKSDARKLARWLNEYLDDEWDRQMQNDLSSGKLDSLIAQAESNIEANQVKDLDEIINDT